MMRLSRTLKSSAQSLPSPNGAHIATILPSKLSIRATRSLEITRVINLPSELAVSISWFLWSSSSERLLVGSADCLKVYSITDPKFSATITHPVSVTKVAFVTFGANDNEVCIFSDFGLKLSIFNLGTSKSTDVNSPKFYNAGVATRGFSYRPHTLHLALLTRSDGKDIVSIHSRETIDVVRSWCPDTIDAQGLIWSLDGRWLVVWESASQGHRILIYTADGYLFKSWNGPLPVSDEDIEVGLGAGIKLLDWSRNGMFIAVGDYSRRVTVLTSPALAESISLLHPTTIKPVKPLQIWQEQLNRSQASTLKRDFAQATQTICPPSITVPPNSSDSKTGTNILTFDNSNTLLATRTEDMPTTLWVWDIGTRILRAVLILHSPIAKVAWHPTIDELLMIRCEGDENRGLVHIWDPSWESPKILDFNNQIPGGKVLGKTIVRWLDIDTQHPVLFFSDSQDCLLASLSGPEDGNLPWDEIKPEYDIYGQREESPLNLVPASNNEEHKRSNDDELLDKSFASMSGGSDEMEDTFQFRKFVEPKDTNSWT